MSEDTYEFRLEMAAFYAQQADEYRRTNPRDWFSPRSRTYYIRDKQNASAAWAAAAQEKQQEVTV